MTAAIVLGLSVAGLVTAFAVWDSVNQRRQNRVLTDELERAKVDQMVAGRSDAWLRGMIVQALTHERAVESDVRDLFRAVIVGKPSEGNPPPQFPEDSLFDEKNYVDWTDESVIPAEPLFVLDDDDEPDVA